MIPAVTDLLSVEANGVLEIHYTCRTRQVSYSIADFGGNVLIRGNFKHLVDNRLSVAQLKKGLYTFCIVDGDSLVKNRFAID
jgi:hypothetical protein